MGALEYLDENRKTLYIDDWRLMLQRYVDYCEANHLEVEDLTYPKKKVEDIHFVELTYLTKENRECKF